MFKKGIFYKCNKYLKFKNIDNELFDWIYSLYCYIIFYCTNYSFRHSSSLLTKGTASYNNLSLDQFVYFLRYTPITYKDVVKGLCLE